MKRKLFATGVVLLVMATPLFGAQSAPAQPAAQKPAATQKKSSASKQSEEQKKAAVLKETAALKQAADAAAQRQAAAAKQTAQAKPATRVPGQAGYGVAGARGCGVEGRARSAERGHGEADSRAGNGRGEASGAATICTCRTVEAGRHCDGCAINAEASSCRYGEG